MSRSLYEKISRDKLEAYLEGTLNEQETAEVDALVDGDEELQALVDEYVSIQIELANAAKQTPSGTASSLEAIAKMKKAIEQVHEPAKIDKRGLKMMIGVACALIAVIFGVMVVYTPVKIEKYASNDMPMSRDGDGVFGEEVDYEAELAEVDAEIDQIEQELPSVAFFDRYKSDEEREKIEMKRSELYELQWERMFILIHLQRYDELKVALNEYVEICGCHKEEAMEMLKELEEKQ